MHTNHAPSAPSSSPPHPTSLCEGAGVPRPRPRPRHLGPGPDTLSESSRTVRVESPCPSHPSRADRSGPGPRRRRRSPPNTTRRAGAGSEFRIRAVHPRLASAESSCESRWKSDGGSRLVRAAGRRIAAPGARARRRSRISLACALRYPVTCALRNRCWPRARTRHRSHHF